MRWFSLESPVVERKYFFTRFKADNYLSLTALVAGMTINSCLKLQLPLTAVHFSRKNSTFVTELNSNLKISGGSSAPCPSPCYRPGLQLLECSASMAPPPALAPSQLTWPFCLLCPPIYIHRSTPQTLGRCALVTPTGASLPLEFAPSCRILP